MVDRVWFLNSDDSIFEVHCVPIGWEPEKYAAKMLQRLKKLRGAELNCAFSEPSGTAKIQAWQDSLLNAFSHKGVHKFLGPVLDLEPLVGQVFVKKYYGHRVLTDSFMEFFGETIAIQAKLNATVGWPQDRPYYVTNLMMFLTMFRSLRSSELLSLNGYPLQGYVIQRSIKDQAFALCAIVNAYATFDELFGWAGLDPEKMSEAQAQVVRNRMNAESAAVERILGKDSGLPAATQSELINWNRLFNVQAHRGLFSLFRDSGRLLGKNGSISLGPTNDDLVESMYLNRCTEVCWMIHRLLPFMRRAETPKSDLWNEHWKLLDQSFIMMVNGLGSLGKKIAPAIKELISTKFAFDTESYFSEPKAH